MLKYFVVFLVAIAVVGVGAVRSLYAVSPAVAQQQQSTSTSSTSTSSTSTSSTSTINGERIPAMAREERLSPLTAAGYVVADPDDQGPPSAPSAESSRLNGEWKVNSERIVTPDTFHSISSENNGNTLTDGKPIILVGCYDTKVSNGFGSSDRWMASSQGPSVTIKGFDTPPNANGCYEAVVKYRSAIYDSKLQSMTGSPWGYEFDLVSSTSYREIPD